jgi:predicted Rossmann fold flavoprotein
MNSNTDLIIVGAGAAGLMAACAAGEAGLRTVLIERKHRPGRKLLMCGNNRCNLTNTRSAQAMLDEFAEPIAPFLAPALKNFTPQQLREWLQQRGLKTSAHKDRRVFPASERADDVLHFFTDRLRDLQVPLLLNAPVETISKTEHGFEIRTPSLTLSSGNLLLATGGVSYPKTGSVGDGQRFAAALGHHITPYRPGLVGFVLEARWLTSRPETSFPATKLNICQEDNILAATDGEIVTTRWGISGPACVNASRIIARQNIRDYHLLIDLLPHVSEQELIERFKQRARKCKHSADLLQEIHPSIRKDLTQHLLRNPPDSLTNENSRLFQQLAKAIKGWKLYPAKTRPLKEAMVTVGGVMLDEIDPQTMESRIVPGLFFAGEVMDVDGPTGGYNLQAAFSTAHLAIQTLSKRLPCKAVTMRPKPSKKAGKKKHYMQNKNRKNRRKRR